ncbi:MAG: tRNA lysidine(34) synthetase TilS [Bacteroidaceae bacterium]|nr:tRNA lysidine(34) synthetase TilS [Bacteroidaceae bacterium]
MKSTLPRIVEQTIRKHTLLSAHDKVLVALSGGADSVALLRVMHDLGYNTEALHCNFHLRGDESDRDEKFVTKLCHERGIPLHIRHFDTQGYAKEKKVSIEMAARELRYAWFEEMLQERDAHAICVAHHQKDQAETLLLNLIRGTGIRGLAGMHYQNGHIIRPLLDATKEEVETYLHDIQQDWVDDSTNFERDALRNRIRLDVLPLLQQLNPQAIHNLAKTAEHMQETLCIYERGLCQQKTTTMTFKFKTELHEALLGCGFNATQEDNIWEGKTGSIVESSTHRLLKDHDQYILRTKQEEAKVPVLTTNILERSQLTKMQKGCIYLDNEKVKQPLSIRKTKAGDRFTPFGMKGTKLVSDLLTDLKLNRFEKEDQYVLTDGEDQILWVIGRRASNLYRVTDHTRQVLVIETEHT